MTAIFVGGIYNGKEVTLEELEQIGNGSYSADYSESRKKGACVPREELDNRPLVDGYLSPMWDGGKLRYETQSVYDLMSN